MSATLVTYILREKMKILSKRAFYLMLFIYTFQRALAHNESKIFVAVVASLKETFRERKKK
jgi:hypothetical protein